MLNLAYNVAYIFYQKSFLNLVRCDFMLYNIAYTQMNHVRKFISKSRLNSQELSVMSAMVRIMFRPKAVGRYAFCSRNHHQLLCVQVIC